jgi:hypothetical protein
VNDPGKKAEKKSKLRGIVRGLVCVGLAGLITHLFVLNVSGNFVFLLFVVYFGTYFALIAICNKIFGKIDE